MSKSESDEIRIDVKRTDLILRFIRQNPNCTKAMVIRHMKGKSSINTTHYIILNLIDKGKLNINKINIQTHLLTINEQDPFNMFHKMLVDIEALVEEMQEFMSSEDIDKNPKIKKLFVGLDGIENSYRQLFSMITMILCGEITAGAGGYDEFYPILLEGLDAIYYKFSYYRWDKKTTKEILAISSKNLEASFKAYNNQIKVKTNIGDRLLKALEDFEDFKKEILDVRYSTS